MNLGSNRLHQAMKTLMRHWDETKDAGWSDQVRQDFEDHHLAPLERQIVATIKGMEDLAEVITKIRKQCS